MAGTELAIWNRALGRVGQPPFAVGASKSITGASKASQCVLTISASGYEAGNLLLIDGVVGMAELNHRIHRALTVITSYVTLEDEDSTNYAAWASVGYTYILPDEKKVRVCYDAWADVRDEVLRAHPWNSVTKRGRVSRLQAAKTITGATAASPVVVTTSAAHGYSRGDVVLVEGVVGMVELNDRYHTVGTVPSTTTYQLSNEDGSEYTAYSSGGTSKKALTPLTPDYDFANVFDLPWDCLRVLNLIDSTKNWMVEGRKLLTDAGDTVPIRYIRKNYAPETWDPLLTSALIGRLAVEICEEITQSNTKKEALEAKYQRLLDEARLADGQEQSASDIEEDTFINARL